MRISRGTRRRFSRLAHTLGSSVHFPVTIAGKPATLTYWSKEKNAFPRRPSIFSRPDIPRWQGQIVLRPRNARVRRQTDRDPMLRPRGANVEHAIGGCLA